MALLLKFGIAYLGLGLVLLGLLKHLSKSLAKEAFAERNKERAESFSKSFNMMSSGTTGLLFPLTYGLMILPILRVLWGYFSYRYLDDL